MMGSVMVFFKSFLAMVRVVPIAVVLLALAGCTRTVLINDTTAPSANPFLWQSSLNVLSNLPIDHTDPVSGVITTAWYALPESPQVEYRFVVRILGSELRANNLRVSVFKRTMAPVDLAEEARTELPAAGESGDDEADTVAADEADFAEGTVPEGNAWLFRRSQPVHTDTLIQVEDTILSEARRLRIRSLSAQ